MEIRLCDPNVYILTIPRNRERLIALQESFSREPRLCPVLGHDCLDWMTFSPSKTVDVAWQSRWQDERNFGVLDDKVIQRMADSWNRESFDSLYSEGIVAGPWEARTGVTPGQVACAMTHRIAWLHFIHSGKPWAVFLEDDAMSHPDLRGTIWESVVEQLGGQDADHILLYSDPELVKRNSNGEIDKIVGTGAYAFSRKMAFVADAQCFPLRIPHDEQLYCSCYGFRDEDALPEHYPFDEANRQKTPLTTEGITMMNYEMEIRSSIWMNDKE